MRQKNLYEAPETKVLELLIEQAILETSGGEYPGNDEFDL